MEVLADVVNGGLGDDVEEHGSVARLKAHVAEGHRLPFVHGKGDGGIDGDDGGTQPPFAADEAVDGAAGNLPGIGQLEPDFLNGVFQNLVADGGHQVFRNAHLHHFNDFFRTLVRRDDKYGGLGKRAAQTGKLV